MVAAIACANGLKAENGVAGVGQATRNSVIASFKNDKESVKKKEDKKIQKEKEKEQEKVDKILEKIKKKGYSSLTDNEKNTLFKK